MAQVMVFVDDAVRGTLPAVCIKDGMPTGDRLTLRQELGDRAGLGVAWLLLLAGPLGWLGLLMISVSRSGRREVLAVQVPMSEPAYQRGRAAERLRRIAGAATLVALVALVLLLATGSGPLAGLKLFLVGTTVVGAVVTLIISERRCHTAGIGIDLDASRRWVIFTRVHESFAAAYERQAASTHAR